MAPDSVKLRLEPKTAAQEIKQTKKVLEILNKAFLISSGTAPNVSESYSWLRAFDKDEISLLVAEVYEAYHAATKVPDGWAELDAVIHEWQESAIATLSNDLADAWQDKSEEMPLTPPVVNSL